MCWLLSIRLSDLSGQSLSASLPDLQVRSTLTRRDVELSRQFVTNPLKERHELGETGRAGSGPLPGTDSSSAADTPKSSGHQRHRCGDSAVGDVESDPRRESAKRLRRGPGVVGPGGPLCSGDRAGRRHLRRTSRRGLPWRCPLGLGARTERGFRSLPRGSERHSTEGTAFGRLLQPPRVERALQGYLRCLCQIPSFYLKAENENLAPIF